MHYYILINYYFITACRKVRREFELWHENPKVVNSEGARLKEQDINSLLSDSRISDTCKGWVREAYNR